MPITNYDLGVKIGNEQKSLELKLKNAQILTERAMLCIIIRGQHDH